VEVGSSLKQDSPNFSTNNLFQFPNKNKNGWLQWLVVVMLHEQRWLSCFMISAWAMINCIVFAEQGYWLFLHWVGGHQLIVFLWKQMLLKLSSKKY
jgi:hypothetical protein